MPEFGTSLRDIRCAFWGPMDPRADGGAVFDDEVYADDAARSR